MESVPLNLSLILNLIIQLLLIYVFRLRVVRKNQNEDIAKRQFTVISILLTLVVSVFGYYALSIVFELFGVEIFHGHAGVAFVLPFVVNTIVGFLSVIFGRSVIGWRAMQW